MSPNADSAAAAALDRRMRELAGDLLAAQTGGALDLLDDAAIGRLFAAIVRVHAERAQRTEVSAPPFAGNATVSATDAMIACSAILDAVGLETFELSLWQNMTSIKPATAAAVDRAEPAEAGR